MNRPGDVKRFLASQRVGDLALMGGLCHLVLDDHTPADPAGHPIRPVIPAVVQSVPSFELVDAPFDASPSVAATPIYRCDPVLREYANIINGRVEGDQQLLLVAAPKTSPGTLPLQGFYRTTMRNARTNFAAERNVFELC